MKQEKKEVKGILGLLVMLFSIGFFLDYYAQNFGLEFRDGDYINQAIIKVKESQMLRLFTSFLPVIMFLYVYLGIGKVMDNRKQYFKFIYPYAICYLFVCLYWREGNYFYNLIVYPSFVALASIFGVFFGLYFQKELENDTTDLWEDINTNPPGELVFEFNVKTEKNISKVLSLPSPVQGVYIQGGAGSGKSASIFEPFIYQGIMKGCAAFIYDFKGSESPLSRCAIATLRLKEKEIVAAGFKVPQVHYVNFMKPSLTTGWINPLSRKYMRSDIAIYSLADTIFKSMDKEAIKKTDFWAKNGILYTASVAQYLVNNHEGQYATLPHMITMLIQPIADVANLISTDRTVADKIGSIRSAIENEAASQLSGIEATAAVPFSQLYNKEIFWPLTPKNIEQYPTQPEISFQINDMDNPTVFCIANDEGKRASIGPIISCVASVIVQVLNDLPEDKSYYKTLYMIDELPTLFVKDLDFIPATMRSKKVMTILGVQGYSQLIRDYGKENAEVIKDNMGNQFYGMTNSGDDADKTAKLAGKYDKMMTSISTSDDNTNPSYSMQQRDKLQGVDISGQQVGHFMVKIANGKPPYHYIQLADGRIHKLLKVDEKEIAPIKKSFTPFITEDKELENSIIEELMQDSFDNIRFEIYQLISDNKERMAKEKEEAEQSITENNDNELI